MKTTLLNLSNILIEDGYPDLFDFQVDGDILDIENMTGSVADSTGDRVFEFKIIELDADSDHLETLVEYENDAINKKLKTMLSFVKNEDYENKEYKELYEYLETILGSLYPDLVLARLEIAKFKTIAKNK